MNFPLWPLPAPGLLIAAVAVACTLVVRDAARGSAARVRVGR